MEQNGLVEKNIVHERDRKCSRQTAQEIEVYFNFIGNFVPPHFMEVELTSEEQEELRKREEWKDSLSNDLRLCTRCDIKRKSCPKMTLNDMTECGIMKAKDVAEWEKRILF